MLTVVSKRAVYMAHFWETYSINLNDDAADFPRWEERVLNVVSGQGPPDPNLPPQGGSLNPNNFNRHDDETKAFIMSPLKPTIQEWKDDKLEQFKYPQKLKLLQGLLTTLVPGVIITVKGYRALNYSIPAGKAQENQNDRGIALFQYDPNSDGNGQRAYRLFYQQTIYMHDVVSC